MTQSHLSTGALGAFLALWSVTALSQTLTVSMWVPPQHVFYRDVFQPLGADLEKATSGRVKFSFLAKAVAAPQGTADAVRDGLADISFIIHGFTPGRFPLTKLAEIPLLSDSSETLSVAYHRVYEKHFASANEHKGLKVLAMFTLTPTQIMTKSKPVRSLADLSGTKLRVAGGISADVAGALGATPVVKPVTDTYELLAGGVVDGTVIPVEGYALFNLKGQIRHVTIIPGGMGNTSVAAIMNPDAFNRLSTEDRSAFERLLGEALARRAGNAEDRVSRDGRDTIVKDGIAIGNADPSLLEAIRTKSADVERAWLAEAKARGADGAKALADLREEIRRAAR